MSDKSGINFQHIYQVGEYYLQNPNKSLRDIGEYFGKSEATMSATLTSFFSERRTRATLNPSKKVAIGQVNEIKAKHNIRQWNLIPYVERDKIIKQMKLNHFSLP